MPPPSMQPWKISSFDVYCQTSIKYVCYLPATFAPLADNIFFSYAQLQQCRYSPLITQQTDCLFV